jgi:hypothetical protein
VIPTGRCVALVQTRANRKDQNDVQKPIQHRLLTGRTSDEFVCQGSDHVVQRVLPLCAQDKDLRQGIDQTRAHVTSELVCPAEEYRRCRVTGIVTPVSGWGIPVTNQSSIFCCQRSSGAANV